MLEPSEGKSDYSLVDGLIREARVHNLRLVLLWFGSWKNTGSSYTPDWVKGDFEHSPRVQLRNGSGTERLTPSSEANREADARAFRALMHLIRQVDRDFRHRDPDAGPSSSQMAGGGIQSLRELGDRFPTGSGNGRPVHGVRVCPVYRQDCGGGESRISSADVRERSAQSSGLRSGTIQQGRPLPHSLDIWRAGGPQLDFFAPDIYFYFEFKTWCAQYDRPQNPLFIAEATGGPASAANVLYAIGQPKSLGFPPFGIDGMEGPGSGADALARSYEVLSQLAPLINPGQPAQRARVRGLA